MKITLPIFRFTEPPFVKDKYIKILDNGEEKKFFCKVIQPTDFKKAFTYVLAEGFPRELAKIIWGTEAIIEEGNYEGKKNLSVYRNKRGRSKGKKKALESKSTRKIILSL